MENEIHIGQLIEKKRKELSIKKVELARRVGTSRENVTMITYRKSIQVDMLRKFCVALNYDFFQHYALQKNENIKQQMQKVIDQKQNQIDELQKQAEEMKKTMQEQSFVIDVLRGKK
ncbi:MAG: helix-turn-helix transcriptional regulator [Bacteroidetes bacterium]|nr:helix-turn-helix transcriptional regulator [Bacteroidota bacterium]